LRRGRVSRIESALDRLRDAAERIQGLDSPYPLHKPSFGPGCCAPEVDELLGDRAARLSEYAEYLRLCRRVDGADVFNGYFLFSPLLVVRQTEAPRRLHVGHGADLSEVEVLTVGGDGGGNLFLMSTSPDAPGAVWKWDHEAEVRFDGVAKDGLTRVADSFGGFLERVATDWEHFVARDRTWNYISG
jgi:hypothetical protein